VLAVDAATGEARRVWGFPRGDAGFDDGGGGGGGGGARCAFAGPQGLAVEAATNILYAADTDHHAVRRVDLTSGAVTTVGGNGTQGYDYGAGKAGAAQRLPSPWDLAIANLPAGAGGRSLVVAMAGTHQLWALPLGAADAPTVPAGLAATHWTVSSGTGREAPRDARTAASTCWA